MVNCLSCVTIFIDIDFMMKLNLMPLTKITSQACLNELTLLFMSKPFLLPGIILTEKAHL